MKRLFSALLSIALLLALLPAAEAKSEAWDGSALTINPTAEVNRAEVCTMLQRYYTGLAK